MLSHILPHSFYIQKYFPNLDIVKFVRGIIPNTPVTITNINHLPYILSNALHGFKHNKIPPTYFDVNIVINSKSNTIYKLPNTAYFVFNDSFFCLNQSLIDASERASVNGSRIKFFNVRRLNLNDSFIIEFNNIPNFFLAYTMEQLK